MNCRVFWLIAALPFALFSACSSNSNNASTGGPDTNFTFQEGDIAKSDSTLTDTKAASTDAASSDATGTEGLSDSQDGATTSDDSDSLGNSDLGADAPLPATCPGAPGCSCTDSSSCTSGLCLDTADGKRCASPCGDGCGTGQTCVNLAGSGGQGYDVCIGQWGKLCYPCDATQDCQVPGVKGSLCVTEGTLGSFCGAACKADVDCPNGYACLVGQSPEGPKSLQCIRVGGDGNFATCSCTPSAKTAALQTTCYAEQKDLSGKVVGKCPGARTCGPTGLGACVLVGLQPEVCDGIDNDCNGKIDDNASGCGPGQLCGGGKCVGAGACSTGNGGCDVHATCSDGGTNVATCTCKSGYSGDGKTCLADCAVPWGGSLGSGKTVSAYASDSVACGATCSQETRTCNNGSLSGSNSFGSCAPAACAGQCPSATITFDWGITGSGPCKVTLPASSSSNWYYTDKADLFLGGIFASCDAASGTWQISQQKCVPANGATSCFPTGTKCDGSGPALFPYPHCWTCCNATDPVPGTCK